MIVATIAPQLTINGSESVTVTFEEEMGQLSLFSGGNRVSITDSDSMHLAEATLILEPGSDASLESLRLNSSALPQGVGPQSNYQSEQGLFTITGDYTAIEYESILSAVEYVSTNQNPDDTMRPIVTCRVRDTSNLWSNNLTITISIMAFNDPPVIYLGGPSQLNYSVTLPHMGSTGLPIANQEVKIQDPDTTRIQSVQIVLELQTTNGDMIDLSRESLHSPSGSLQQDSVNRNVYNLFLMSHLAYVTTLPQVGYENRNPSAVVPGTRVVRVTALDNELVTNAGSRLPGIMSQPSFTFIHVGEEPPSLTTSADSTEQQTLPTTTEIDTTSTSVLTDTTVNIGTTELTTALDPTDSTTATTYATSTSGHDQKLKCPEELNLPLIPGSTLGLLVYNWTQTPVEEDHVGQSCPVVSPDNA